MGRGIKARTHRCFGDIAVFQIMDIPLAHFVHCKIAVEGYAHILLKKM